MAAARESGVKTLGIVDRDGVYGLPRAHKAAKEAGIQLVCGATLSLWELPSVVLLAEDLRGWSNLCRLITRGRGAVEKGRAELEIDALLNATEGLHCVLRPGWKPLEAQLLKEAFGERLSILWARQRLPGDRQREEEAAALGMALDTPLLASNDVLYHHADRHRLADVLTCIRRGVTLEQAGRQLRANDERYLLSEAEWRARYAGRPEAMARAEAVAESCQFSLSELKYFYPKEVVPEGHTPMGWLRILVEKGLSVRYPEGISEKVRAQVEHELRVIETLDFPSYFLTIHDIVQFARGRGILCQGRGSAANSAVCYVLGITAVDPTRASLLFERFISVERAEPPDIDVDFEHERREEVIQYLYSRYGRDRAALVNEVTSYRGRSSIRDVGKVFGLTLDQVERLAKTTDRWSAGSDVPLSELVKESGLDPTDVGVRQTLQMAKELEGFPRHISIHVGGFVIAEKSLEALVPIEPATMEDRTVIQWDKDDVDTVGFVKVDVLGLGMLTAIRRAFDLVAGHTGQRFELATIPAEDPAVYQMFQHADTVGVFQIESRAQMSMLPRLRPENFYDLVVEVALVRPGPIQGGMVHPYLRRRRGEEPVTYAHPKLIPILQRTLGIPLFQEQVMQIAIEVGGFTAGEADNLRRAMGAWRKRGNLDVIGRKLVEGMRAQGISEEFSEAIYAQILGFGEYGFPESHAASFALLVYVSGWLKLYFPAAFASALINSQPMGFYSPRALLADAERHGVEIRQISVLYSDWDCRLERDDRKEAVLDERAAVRVGFRLIRGFPEEAARRLMAAREEGQFRDIPDLARRSGLGRRELLALAESEALHDFGMDRRKAAWVLQGLWTDMPLFVGLARQEPEPELAPETEWERVENDFQVVGMSLGKHPLALLREGLRRQAVVANGDLGTLKAGHRVRVAGLVTCRQRPGTASGVVFMTLEDETGMSNLVVWPKVWAEHRVVARSSSILVAEGKLQRDGGEVPGAPVALSIVVDRLWAPEETPSVDAKSRNFH